MNTKLLRQKVLDLAIHGKLVPQNPEHEPASKLLERIRGESLPLATAGKPSSATPSPRGKAPKTLAAPISEDEIPFEIPENWCWCRISDICELRSGTTLDSTFEKQNGKHIYIKVGDMNIPDNKKEIVTSKMFIDEDFKNIIPINSIVFPKRGGAILTNKKRLVLKEPIYIDLNLMALTPICPELLDYLYWWFMGIDLGQLNNGSNIPQINNKDIAPLYLPLPPLEEQKLIVEEIERIFALIDTVEQNKTDLETVIKQTKSKILDLAIHGKLVPQDKTDEPASKMLEKLRAEKEAKIAKGQLKRDKNDSYIYKSTDGKWLERKADGSEEEIEVPFEIPESWSWCFIKNVCRIFGRIGFRGYAKDDLVEKGKGAVSLSPSNIKNMSLDFSECTYLSWFKYEESPEIQLVLNDIVVVKTGSSYGKTAIVEVLPVETTLNPQLMVLKEISIDQKYLCFLLNSSYFREIFEVLVNGTAIPTFSQEKFGNNPIPIPPLEEQKRIVDKIEQIYSKINLI